MRRQALTEITNILIAACIGICFAIWICPGMLFDPGSMLGIKHDIAQHFCGWAFWRDEPWTWPLTKVKSIFYPSGLSIVYTDSYPALAIILKCFRSFMPETFVFHGIAFAINVALMAYSGNLLFRKLTGDKKFAWIAGIFLIFSTVFVHRLKYHMALSSHWLLIFSFIPILSGERDKMPWMYFLLMLSFGVHAYISAMVFAVCIAYIFQIGESKFRRVSTLFIISIASMYFWGYFIGGIKGTTGIFGKDKIELIGFFIPYAKSLFITKCAFQWGTSYLGLPIVAALPFVIYGSVKRGPCINISRAFLIILLCCSIFAFMGKVNFIGKPIYFVPWPTKVARVLAIFRFNGRFIWPFYYFIIIYSLLFIRKRCKRYYIISIAMLCISLSDSYPVLMEIKKMLCMKNPAYSFDKQRWDHVLKGKKHMFMCESVSSIEDRNLLLRGMNIQERVIYLALTHHMTINSMYVARRSRSTDSVLIEQERQFMENGFMEPDTVYVTLTEDPMPCGMCRFMEIEFYRVFY